jgi:DNA-binding NarL/FixJ family response regulator
MKKIRLLIVDDHPLFRQGVADTLALESDLQVIGQASDGEEALQALREIRPDVAVIDVNLPGLNGQQVTQQVAAEKLETRVILLTAYHDAEQQVHAIQVGAAAYCTKDVEPERLVEVIRLVANGLYVVGERELEQDEMEVWLLSQADSAPRPYSDLQEPFEPLSVREMEVLGCITRGLSNKEIASALGISHQTVKNHVTAILRKLGVEDRTQAALYALRKGWVRLHQLDEEAQE